ncbi:MAG: UDP-N-acetylmuramoyl-L-alanine--D-glutamate ligase [Bifidobacteriaceae bacterium]|jgi:UDP-N-acetylmuramoylalanine--D-glutamate ligase|nr:UDP-N-acetylmuramoyl-L-alanine--D-glutamate ligase [Bifidobacteriaceae bacterium]
MTPFPYQRVAVAGLGTSGRAAQAALEALGVTVLGVDDDPQVPGAVPSDQADLSGVELVVASPGWPPHGAFLSRVAAAGRPIWSEVELAWRLRARPDAPWLALTGTNGKTTTVEMTAAMLQAGGALAVAAGNVGNPLVAAVADPAVDVFACELSSFQLHYTESLAPLAAAVLNVAPDHLDWHGGWEGYAADKARIYQRTGRACIYNVADPATEAMVRAADVAAGAVAVGFTLGAPRLGELGLVDGLLVDRAFHERRYREARPIASIDDLAHLAGPDGRLAPHVVANALAAAALALAYGTEPAAIARALRQFELGAHRLAVVPSRDGVTWIDDSKATNAHAAAAALAAGEPGRVIWIAGGLAKGARFEDLVQARGDRLKAAILIGVDHHEWAEALARHAAGVPVYEVDPAQTGSVMQSAVRQAAALAQPGDVVLLAPAAASMDQFTNYAQRGEAFAAAVRALGD